jgi:phospholipid/cholesterol/gamma-HCH transport system substrate-binding protein
MREKSIEIKVGILVLVALGVLGAFIFVLGNFSLSKGFWFFVEFDFSGNLQAGAPVKVAGIKVGKVEAVEYRGGEKDPRSGRRVYVRAKAWVEERVRGTIFDDAEFFINTQGVLGEQYLEIVPGTPSHPAIESGQVLVGVTPPRMDLVVARLYETLDSVTRLLREDKQTITDLLRSGARALRSVDQLLVENKQEIKGLLASLDKFTDESAQLVKGVRAGVGDPQRLRSILGGLEKTTAAVSRNIDGLIARTSKALDGVGSIAEAVGPAEKQRIRRALQQLITLADQVTALTGEARIMVQRLNQGKGTAGALIAREELYDDLKEMVRDLKRHPWKFLWKE